MRSTVFAAASLAVPAVWAAVVLLALWWRAPWTWIAPVILAAVWTFALASPIAGLFRRLAQRWSGIRIESGYRVAAPITEMSTGYWWNGHTYERSRRDAERDQRMRTWFRDPAYWRDVRWLGVAAVTVGPLCAVPVVALVGAGFAFAYPGVGTVVVGVVLVLVAAVVSRHVWRVAPPVAARHLRAPEATDMAERVQELTEQRADATAAQAAEIRRIERSLHDGAQARLVAVGLSLATAERLMDSDPERARVLVREAREATSTSLAELRDLVRGVNPPVLVERGLVDAVRALALDSASEVTVAAEEAVQLEHPIASALYFSVAELLANVGKHAGSARVDVHIARDGHRVVVEVRDDGPGGAASTPGGGLDGIRGRLAVFDGALTVDSPAGGPTSVRMVVPCG
ncbi:sensor histidine kinase [Speluncibacter jeojiensis]|uniref:sensor histidine kinase n=1 Tax=Speluncibacter jeojiensis TaxID=2710754 RepID=UPI002410390E|nr:histidine kinase [Rhodococcus sp. D2-41]